MLDVPCAIASFYADAQSPRIPALAVAIGPNVFIYRNLRPYYKFTLPLDVVSEIEKTVWYVIAQALQSRLCIHADNHKLQLHMAHRQQVYAGTLNTAQARKALQRLSNNGPGSAAPSTVARELQDLDEASQDAEIAELAQQFKGEAPLQQSTITCMTTIKKAYDEVGAPVNTLFAQAAHCCTIHFPQCVPCCWTARRRPSVHL